MEAKCSLNPLDSSVCFSDPKNTVPCTLLCGGTEQQVRATIQSVQKAEASNTRPASEK